MKKITIIATDQNFAENCKNNIERYMSRYAETSAYTLSDVEHLEHIDGDVILLSTFTIFQEISEKIDDVSKVVTVTLALNKYQVEMLKTIEPKTKALLVNFDNRSCIHTMSCIFDAGFNRLNLIPYWGGDYDSTIKVAITPNEVQLVPKGIEQIINIGESSVDMNMLYKIAEKLDVYDQFVNKEAKAAREEYYSYNSSIDKLLATNLNMTDKLSTLMKLMNEGIIITDATDIIYMTNQKAEYFLREKTNVLKGFNIIDILPDLKLGSTKEQLIRVGGKNIICNTVEVKSYGEVAGHIITLGDFEEIEEQQHKIRNKLNVNELKARYHLEDIIGSSVVIKSAINDAMRFSSSDAPVLLIGESGSGKEMFAQGIHNRSFRRKYNFVAINCAAIPERLLESELFGYEEGSFTGAKKGGKLGLFEMAHKGTLFLDEIGEMPVHLQAKLLRALEEKVILRVGSDKPIPVDVRIISATNKGLKDMVREGTFRRDLYYRLNVLPINIPSLRERGDDVIDIFYEMNKNSLKIELSNAAKGVFRRHLWEGNVRELRNVCEYLQSLGKDYIDADDLVFLDSRALIKSEKPRRIENDMINRFILNEGRDIELYKEILEVLSRGSLSGLKMGRQAIADEMKNKGLRYTEAEVRKGLNRLAQYSFIRSAKGRAGSVILDEGEVLLEEIKKYIN